MLTLFLTSYISQQHEEDSAQLMKETSLALCNNEFFIETFESEAATYHPHGVVRSLCSSRVGNTDVVLKLDRGSFFFLVKSLIANSWGKFLVFEK